MIQGRSLYKTVLMSSAAMLLTATMAAQEQNLEHIVRRPGTAHLSSTLLHSITESWTPIREQYNVLKMYLRPAKQKIPNIYPSVINDPVLALDGSGGDFHLVEYVDECMTAYHQQLGQFLEDHDTSEGLNVYRENHPMQRVIVLPDIGAFRNIRVRYGEDPINVREDGRIKKVRAQDIFADLVLQDGDTVTYWITRPQIGTDIVDGEAVPLFNRYIASIQGTRDDDLQSARWELLDNPGIENIIEKPERRKAPAYRGLSAEYSGRRQH